MKIILTMCMLIAIAQQTTAQTVAPTTDMNVKRVGHQAQPLGNGKVLVFGGQTTSSTFQPIVHASCEIYDSSTKTWTTAASMNIARTNHASVVTQAGKILAIGGDSSGTNSRLNVESYDPVTDKWTIVGTLNKPRNSGDAIVLDNGQVVVVGNYPSSIETGPADGSGLWTETSIPNPGDRIPEDARMIRMNDSRILVVGAVPGSAGNTGIIITQSGSISTTTNDMTEDHNSAGLAILPNGKVLITGGTATGVNEVFDPATNMFSTGATFNNSRLECPLMKMTDGRIAVFGPGVIGNPDNERDMVEIYDPANANWTIKKGHKFWGTEAYRATPLGDGKYLITGGVEHMQLKSTGTKQAFIFNENETVDIKDVQVNTFNIAYYPSEHNLKIKMEHNSDYEAGLFDISGRLIRKYTFHSNEASLYTPHHLTDGVYFIKVIDTNNGTTNPKKLYLY